MIEMVVEQGTWKGPDAYEGQYNLPKGEPVRLYFLELREDGVRMPVGKPQGYETLEEATQEAKKKVDDALPQNTVRILKEVGYAFLAGDGCEEVKMHEDSGEGK